MVSNGRAKPLVREIVVATKSVSSRRRAVPGGRWSRRTFSHCQLRRRGPAARSRLPCPVGDEISTHRAEASAVVADRRRMVGKMLPPRFRNGLRSVAKAADGVDGIAGKTAMPRPQRESCAERACEPANGSGRGSGHTGLIALKPVQWLRLRRFVASRKVCGHEVANAIGTATMRPGGGLTPLSM